MNVLVTGGAGFIGSHTAEKLIRLGHVVTVLDNLSTGKMANLPPGCAFVHGDVRDHSLIERCVQDQDVVIHLAAFTSVPESFRRPAECFEVNVHGTLNILESAARCSVRKFVFTSSSAVYAEEPNVPKAETMCPEPASPYAVSKLEGEHLLEWYHRRKGLQYIALRYFNVYGPCQAADSDYAAVIPIFIERALLGGTLVIHGDGQQTRDFVYVDDVVEANVLAVLGHACGVYNVGTGMEISILALAQQITNLTSSNSPLSLAPRRPGDILSSTANIKLIRKRLSWDPKWFLSEGLVHSIEWWNRQLTETTNE